jgi:hypothetical protein
MRSMSTVGRKDPSLFVTENELGIYGSVGPRLEAELSEDVAGGVLTQVAGAVLGDGDLGGPFLAPPEGLDDGERESSAVDRGQLVL